MAAGLVAAGLALRLLPATGELGDWAGQEPVWRFALLACLLCSVGIPRQAIAFAAGYADGVVGGTVLAVVCATVACAVDLSWARLVARRWVQARLRDTWLDRLDRRLAAHPFANTLALRLLPLGNNMLLNLAAGVSRVKPVPFVLASCLGYIPQTVIFTLLGSGVRVDRSVQIWVAAGLLAVSTCIGVAMIRRSKEGVLF